MPTDAYNQDPVLIAGDENGSSGNALNLLYYSKRNGGGQ